jgi:hypothetical protein
VQILGAGHAAELAAELAADRANRIIDYPYLQPPPPKVAARFANVKVGAAQKMYTWPNFKVPVR